MRKLGRIISNCFNATLYRSARAPLLNWAASFNYITRRNGHPTITPCGLVLINSAEFYFNLKSATEIYNRLFLQFENFDGSSHNFRFEPTFYDYLYEANIFILKLQYSRCYSNINIYVQSIWKLVQECNAIELINV